MDVLLDYVSFGHFSPYARTGHICVNGYELALRWFQDTVSNGVSFYCAGRFSLCFFFTESLFHYVLTVYIASYGFDTTHAVL